MTINWHWSLVFFFFSFVFFFFDIAIFHLWHLLLIRSRLKVRTILAFIFFLLSFWLESHILSIHWSNRFIILVCLCLKPIFLFNIKLSPFLIFTILYYSHLSFKLIASNDNHLFARKSSKMRGSSWWCRG